MERCKAIKNDNTYAGRHSIAIRSSPLLGIAICRTHASPLRHMLPIVSPEDHHHIFPSVENPLQRIDTCRSASPQIFTAHAEPWTARVRVVGNSNNAQTSPLASPHPLRHNHVNCPTIPLFAPCVQTQPQALVRPLSHRILHSRRPSHFDLQVVPTYTTEPATRTHIHLYLRRNPNSHNSHTIRQHAFRSRKYVQPPPPPFSARITRRIRRNRAQE